MLRNGDLKEYFKPRELSIGPIYAADPGLFKKELKLKLVAHFISDQSDRTGDDLLEEIKNNIVDIKSYFDNKVIESYSSLFLDGCAMLGFIHIYMTRNLNAFNISNGQAFLIQQDLFLFENQIPYRVLEVLMWLDKKSRDETRDWEEEFLRFLRMSNVIAPNDSRNAMDKRFFHHEVSGTNKKPVHILDLNRRLLLPRDDSLSDDNKFLTLCHLRLPTLVVDDSTTRKLFNLASYEMCLPPDLEDCWVTSYINLLDLLIDSEQDVKDLRAVDIVRNCLSSDIEVAQLIDNKGSHCFTPSGDTYEHVKGEIEKHYKRKCAIWVAQICQTHFSSPWTIIALFVATTLHALTAIQTWFAVHPKN
ncbi:hypothetical protein TIFTF001_033206 [Ficus carica]|uniref:Uncharacterized protein n=1 Tax=Ficus carica TaxID=3494 RepID=A0AA88J8X2_FICCA|nr:hypothetical protein TIFTF001_033206 [Ficus carica]